MKKTTLVLAALLCTTSILGMTGCKKHNKPSSSIVSNEGEGTYEIEVYFRGNLTSWTANDDYKLSLVTGETHKYTITVDCIEGQQFKFANSGWGWQTYQIPETSTENFKLVDDGNGGKNIQTIKSGSYTFVVDTKTKEITFTYAALSKTEVSKVTTYGLGGAFNAWEYDKNTVEAVEGKYVWEVKSTAASAEFCIKKLVTITYSDDSTSATDEYIKKSATSNFLISGAGKYKITLNPEAAGTEEDPLVKIELLEKLETVYESEIYLRGSLNSYDTSSKLEAVEGKENTYEISIDLVADVTFKFANSGWGWKTTSIPEDSEELVIDDSNPSDLAIKVVTPGTYTFEVNTETGNITYTREDMTKVEVSRETKVFVGGAFNEWDFKAEATKVEGKYEFTALCAGKAEFCIKSITTINYNEGEPSSSVEWIKDTGDENFAIAEGGKYKITYNPEAAGTEEDPVITWTKLAEVTGVTKSYFVKGSWVADWSDSKELTKVVGEENLYQVKGVELRKNVQYIGYESSVAVFGENEHSLPNQTNLYKNEGDNYVVEESGIYTITLDVSTGALTLEKTGDLNLTEVSRTTKFGFKGNFQEKAWTEQDLELNEDGIYTFSIDNATADTEFCIYSCDVVTYDDTSISRENYDYHKNLGKGNFKPGLTGKVIVKINPKADEINKVKFYLEGEQAPEDKSLDLYLRGTINSWGDVTEEYKLTYVSGTESTNSHYTITATFAKDAEFKLADSGWAYMVNSDMLGDTKDKLTAADGQNIKVKEAGTYELEYDAVLNKLIVKAFTAAVAETPNA